MGGSVEVKSKFGFGTDFIINIKTKCRLEETKFIKKLCILPRIPINTKKDLIIEEYFDFITARNDS